MAAAAPAGAAPGSSVRQVGYVLYAVPGPPLWHQRWTLGEVPSCPSDVVWVSPQGNVQWETHDGSDPDISAVRWVDGMDRPPGIQRRQRFAAQPSPATIAGWLAVATAVAQDCFQFRHPGAPVPVPVFIPFVAAAAGAAPAPAAPAGGAIVPAAPAVAPAVVAGAAPVAAVGGALARGAPAPAGVAGAAGGAAAAVAGGPGVAAGGAAGAAAVVPRPMVAGPGPPPGPAAASGSWRCMMEWRGYHYGDPVVPPAGFAGQGVPPRAALALADGSSIFVEHVLDASLDEFMDRAVAGESRVLPVKMGPSGERHRTLESVVEACHQENVPDMPEPRTVAWCLQHLRSEGKGLEAHFEHFKRLCGLQDNQWGLEEYANMVHVLKYLLFVDQLDATNIVGVELMFRRMQTIEYAYSDRLREKRAGATSGSLTADEQAAFGSLARTESKLMISPKLLESAKAELEKEAALAKSLLKAREAREALGKKKG